MLLLSSSHTSTCKDDFIFTCAGGGGGWRKIVNINISAGDDCPGEWRNATQSGVSFCRVASDDQFTCSSANFSTNGISYWRVCGRARGYQKGHTLGFYGSYPAYNRSIDEHYVNGISITYGSNPCQHIWILLVALVKQETFNGIVLVLFIRGLILLLLLVITITVNQVQWVTLILIHTILMTLYGMEQDVQEVVVVVITPLNLGSIIS